MFRYVMQKSRSFVSERSAAGPVHMFIIHACHFLVTQALGLESIEAAARVDN